MKKVFFSALAFFIICCVCYKISTAILGSGYSYSSFYPVYNGEYNHVTFTDSGGKKQILNGDYNGDQSWTVVNEFPYVNLNSAGVKTVVGRSNTDRITINVENPTDKAIHAEAMYKGNVLTLEVRPTNVTFDISDVKFGIVSWLEDIFNGDSRIVVMIGFPETIYEEFCIQQGSGSIQVNDLYSRDYEFDIGSGTCEFNRPASGDFKSDRFKLTLGSGTAVFSGMESNRFDIDIGSGSFTLDRLSGDGEINMGSGKGSIFFCDKPVDNGIKHELDIGSGNLTLYYPEDGGVVLYSDIGSGKIEIDAFDYIKTITHSNQEDLSQFAMGNGAVDLDIDMGSGIVTIKDSKSYSAPEIISDFKVIPKEGETYSDVQSTTTPDVSQPEPAEISQVEISGTVVVVPGGGEVPVVEQPDNSDTSAESDPPENPEAEL